MELWRGRTFQDHIVDYCIISELARTSPRGLVPVFHRWPCRWRVDAVFRALGATGRRYPHGIHRIVATRGKNACFWLGPDQRITSGPAAIAAAFKGRIHGCTRSLCETSDSTCTAGAVHTWHLADISIALPDVRFEGIAEVARHREYSAREANQRIPTMDSPKAGRRLPLPFQEKHSLRRAVSPTLSRGGIQSSHGCNDLRRLFRKEDRLLAAYSKTSKALSMGDIKTVRLMVRNRGVKISTTK